MSQQADSGSEDEPDRRRFLASGALATGAMAGGLALGYGAFFRCAGQYLYPTEEGAAWMFVTDAASLAPGQVADRTEVSEVLASARPNREAADSAAWYW